MRPAYRASVSRRGRVTRAPPRTPRCTWISDSDSSTRNASRSVGRDTPNRSISSDSGGSMVPSVISPRMNIRRSTVATRSAIFGSRRLVTSIATSTVTRICELTNHLAGYPNRRLEPGIGDRQLATSPLIPHCPTHEVLHDLGGAGVEPLHPGIAPQPGHFVFVDVAVAAVHLQAAVDDLPLDLGGPPFQSGSVLVGEGAVVDREHALVQVGLGGVEFGLHFGEKVPIDLELADRLTERGAFERICLGQVQSSTSGRQRVTSHTDPLAGQVGHQMVKPAVEFADQV